MTFRWVAAARSPLLLCLQLFFWFLHSYMARGTKPCVCSKPSYRSGALVFGGGHVVLPLLETAVVSPGWVSHEAFLAGYGATQAVAGSAFHIRRLSWCSDGPGAKWRYRCNDCSHSVVSTWIASGLRHIAVLGWTTLPSHSPSCDARRERGGCRHPCRGILQSGMDQRHSRAAGLFSGTCRISFVDGLEGACVDGRLCARRSGSNFCSLIAIMSRLHRSQEKCSMPFLGAAAGHHTGLTPPGENSLSSGFR